MEKYYCGIQIADYEEFEDWFNNHPTDTIRIYLDNPLLYLNDILVDSFSIVYESVVDYIVKVYDKDGNIISDDHYPTLEYFFDLFPSLSLPFNLFGLIEGDTSSQEFTDFINTFSLPIEDYPDNAIEIYLLMSPKKQVTKSLKSVGIINGNYTKPITFRNISLDIANYPRLPVFNYLWIPKLNRYYYVQEITQIKDYAQLTLVEDVLMSWGDLIRSQTAFVTRNQNAYDEDIVDKEVTYDYDKSVNYIPVTPLIDVFESSEQGTVTESVGGFCIITVG